MPPAGSPASQEAAPGASGGRLQASTARAAFGGFFLCGLLMSFLGPILPAWGYHLTSEFSTAGLHFLSMAAGILIAVSVSHELIPKRGLTFTLTLASAIACASLLSLSLATPPVSSWWRAAGVLALGGGTGMLITALFHAIHPYYRHDAAASVNIAGILFVLGSLTVALLVAGTFYVYTVPSILVLLALIPGFFAGMFAKTSFARHVTPPVPSWREALDDFRSPTAILFALLLFFQFGNEWAIAGWLAIFLVQRLGVSPAVSLNILAIYWLSLLVGRVLVQFLLPRVSHAWMLSVSVFAAFFGCVVLSFTKALFGAVFGILFIGFGFATIYPLVVEKIGNRFPEFHPTLFNGIFAFAMIGGLLAPWTLGLFADWVGIRSVILLPLAGATLVLLLLVLIWIEAKLSGAATST